MNENNHKIINLEQFNTKHNLKIDLNFFKRRDVNVIESSSPAGKEVILFYIKLICLCNDSNKKSHIRGQIKDDEKLISALTNTSAVMVGYGLELLEKTNMIKRKDGTIAIADGYYS